MLCPFVRSGIMHREFQKYLSSNGMGIDYTKLENYDTQSMFTKGKHTIFD